MKNVLKTILISLSAASIFSSCLKGKEVDSPDFAGYMTVSVNPDGTFFFTGNDGERFYPGDMSRIDAYDTEDGEGVSKDGNRVFIYFSLLKTAAPDGSKYNIALYRIFDILSKDIDVLNPEEDADEVYGDEPMGIIDGSGINGGWLDMGYIYITDADKSVGHTITLLDTGRVPEGVEVPDGYKYLEFRQKPEEEFDPGSYYDGNVSFRLGDILSGNDGLYIRYKMAEDDYEYKKFNAPTESRAASLRTPPLSGMGFNR